MKNIIALIFLAMTIDCAKAQSQPQYQWHFTLKVVDEDGKPVAGAKAGVGYYTHSRPAAINGITDTNGIFIAKHSVEPSGLGYELGFGAEKNGYYSVNQSQLLPPTYDAAKWNQTITLTLKKVGRPIPMYARRAQIEVPVVDKPVGFDLVEYDWVAPYGKGKQGDIVFETHRRWISRHDFDSNLKVTFSNAGDGLLVAPVSAVQGSSGPQVTATAPLDVYASELQRELSNTPAGGWKDDSEAQNYYLRVRTALDENSNVKSALYGKIYGGFTLDPINSKTTFILFTYYLNPTPNDRNVEFDPKQNLLGGLKSFEEVRVP